MVSHRPMGCVLSCAALPHRATPQSMSGTWHRTICRKSARRSPAHTGEGIQHFQPPMLSLLPSLSAVQTLMSKGHENGHSNFEEAQTNVARINGETAGKPYTNVKESEIMDMLPWFKSTKDGVRVLTELFHWRNHKDTHEHLDPDLYQVFNSMSWPPAFHSIRSRCNEMARRSWWNVWSRWWAS